MITVYFEFECLVLLFLCVCACVRMCYRSSSHFQDQSLPTLSPAIWIQAECIMTHFTFKKLFISKFLDFGQCRGSGSEQHPRHCPLCILLFGDASDFGIGPECVRRFHSCNISLQGNKDFCYNNSSNNHVTLQNSTVSTAE